MTSRTGNTGPPPGRLVDIGGRRLHLNETGEGRPSVILEAGAGSLSLDWCLVQPEIARFTHVCSYDRAGYGWSDPGPAPRNADHLADELCMLLTNAGVTPPYLLVGHSFGGHIVRLFARENPDKVAGLILIDATNEGYRAFPDLQRMMKRTERVLHVIRFLARLGPPIPIRGLWESVLPHIRKLPADIRKQYIAHFTGVTHINTFLLELSVLDDSNTQMSQGWPLGNLPLTVISHGTPSPAGPLASLITRLSGQKANRLEQVRLELQMNLATLSTDSRFRVAERSGHAIQIDQPEIVTEAVREMVEAYRSMN